MFSGNRLLEMVVNEYDNLPTIILLDDYIHWERQLKELRSQSSRAFSELAFAMQLAVLLRLQEYDERVGLPLSEMPAANELNGTEKRLEETTQ